MIRSENRISELPPQMLTISEVAALLHVHPNTVRLWSNSALLKAYRIGRRRDRRFKPEDLYTFLRGNSPVET